MGIESKVTYLVRSQNYEDKSMRHAWIILLVGLLSAFNGGDACAEATSPEAGETPAPRERSSEKKDRGDLTMLLDGVEWSATSASARLRGGTLKISASRTDGSASTSLVRQTVNLDIAEFDGPGTYILGMSSMFSVVGFKTDAAEQTDVNQQLADIFSKATMVRLQYAEVVIDSVSDEETVGHFSPGELRSMGGEVIEITDVRFRAIVKQ